MRGMADILLSMVLILFYAGLTGYVANDALVRGRRWIRWGVATVLFAVLTLIVWLVRRRRAPIVHERPARKTVALIYGAAFCLVLLRAMSGVVLRTFGYQAARVEGSAMASTILDRDRLIVEKWRYLSEPPRRGDIVMLRYPLKPEKSFVKRVIGEEGDMVQQRNGRVYRHDVPLEEPYVAEEYRSVDDWGPVVVPEGYYFVMGDHRNNSSDSRHWGFVPAKYIVGQVRIRWFPLSAMRTF